MKNALTLEELNKILDDTKLSAKTYCDRVYEEAIAHVGNNEERFKELIDDLFDKTAAAQIKLMRSELSNLFINKKPNESLPIKTITEFIENRSTTQAKIMSGGRAIGKSVEVAVYIIVSACRVTFTENLTKYLSVNT